MVLLENASVVEWSITTDCKSVALGLRRFESFPAHKMKNVLFLFGGKSNEHEISVVSASNVFKNFPRDEYNPLPVYIDRDGNWYKAKMVINEFSSKEDEVVKVFTEPCTIGKLHDQTFLMNENNEKFNLDIIYPIVHGFQGEDGVLQGMARTFGIPFAGPSMETAFITFDKDITKLLVARSGVGWHLGKCG